MISYAWQSELDSDDLDEVVQLVTAAAEYDAEAGFSKIDPEDVLDAGGGSLGVAHLPIRAKRDLSMREDAPTVIVAYLQMTVDSTGLGTVKYVVHPDYRSRGITTLLVEEVGLSVDGAEGAGGWFGSGATALRCWAYATHPAADRLTMRFGVPAVRRQWTEARHLTGPFAPRIDPVPLPEDFAFTGPSRPADERASIEAVLDASSVPEQHRDAIERDLRRDGAESIVVTGPDGRPVGFAGYTRNLVTYDELSASSIQSLVVSEGARGQNVASALLCRVFEEQEAAGAQLSLLRIDPDDAGAVRMCRLLGFEQAESHTCYQVGHSDVPVPAFD